MPPHGAVQPRTPSPQPKPLLPIYPPAPPGTINIRLITDGGSNNNYPPLPPFLPGPQHHHIRDPQPPLSPLSPRPRPRPLDNGILPHPHPIPIRPGRVGGGGGGLHEGNAGRGGPPSLIIPRVGVSWQHRKKDAFYASWDRFTLQKQRSRKDESSRSSRADKKSSRIAKKNSSRTSSAIPSAAGSEQEDNNEKANEEIQGVVPGLDTDVEGRPTQVEGTNAEGVKSRHRAGASYEAAAHACRTKVDAIVRECRRLNQKYYDRQFNLPDWDTLVHLAADEQPASVKDLLGVGAVKRVEDIFDDPEFFEDGPTPQDIRQGNLGNCYFLAALGALGGKPSLIEKLCVARDEMVGVYGFVFFRDGEWISEIVDDRLCLRYSDDVAKNPTDFLVVTRGDKNPMQQPLSDMSYAVQRLPKDFYHSLRKGSSALYFGSCQESNETWLPLIEKAYAKAHGDYQAIDGGVTGEGIEDLTGGVASFVRSENVLDKDKLWQELMQVNENFLFGCGTRKGRDSESADDEGFVRGHAYTVLAAHEIDAPPIDDRIKRSSKKRKEEEEKRKREIKNGKVRLLKVHNPWGRQEFNGDWSDMSNRWTPELLKELGHTIGDDGTFFISYLDFLKFFPVIDRIRLINHDWTVCQQWTSVNVPWTTDYLDTSFKFTITKAGPVVLVLSQPDTRYFKGLTGRYKFSLHFRLYQEGVETYLLRSMEQSGNMRSCNAEVELEPGTYELLLKITAERFDNKRTQQQIIREYRHERREKLLAVGKSFDLSHCKGKLREFEKENLVNDAKEAKEKTKERLSMGRNLRQRERMQAKRRRRRAMEEIKRKKEIKREKHEEEMKKKKDDAMQKREEERRKAMERDGGETRLRRESHTVEIEKRKDFTPAPLERQDTIIEPITNSETTKDGIVDGQAGSVAQEPTPDCSPPADIERVITPIKDQLEAEIIPPNQPKVFESQVDEIVGKPAPTTAEAGKADPEKPHVDRPKSRAGDSPRFNESGAAEDGRPAVLPRSTSQQRELRGRSPNYDQHEDMIYNERRRNGIPPLPPHHMMRNGPMHRPRGRSISSQGSLRLGADGIPSPISSVADDDFPWDSDIDAPASMASSYDSGSASDSLEDMYPDDPWDATCVIGLRICALDENIDIQVVRGSQSRRGRGEIAMGRARSPA